MGELVLMKLSASRDRVSSPRPWAKLNENYRITRMFIKKSNAFIRYFIKVLYLLFGKPTESLFYSFETKNKNIL